jgi:hypothetical protein
MNGINWFNFSKNIEPELKIYNKEYKNDDNKLSPSKVSGFVNNQPDVSNVVDSGFVNNQPDVSNVVDSGFVNNQPNVSNVVDSGFVNNQPDVSNVVDSGCYITNRPTTSFGSGFVNNNPAPNRVFGSGFANNKPVTSKPSFGSDFITNRPVASKPSFGSGFINQPVASKPSFGSGFINQPVANKPSFGSGFVNQPSPNRVFGSGFITNRPVANKPSFGSGFVNQPSPNRVFGSGFINNQLVSSKPSFINNQPVASKPNFGSDIKSQNKPEIGDRVIITGQWAKGSENYGKSGIVTDILDNSMYKIQLDTTEENIILGILYFKIKDRMESPSQSEKIIEEEKPKKISNALLKLDKVNSTINGFVEEFLSTSGISNNKEYLELWNNTENQNKLCMYIKQKKIKMKETVEERHAKKQEKNLKRENKLKDIHQKRMDKQQSKPKTAFSYFKEDQTIKFKIEHPSWNRKEIHAELQKKWKLIKNTEEAKPYREKTKNDEASS